MPDPQDQVEFSWNPPAPAKQAGGPAPTRRWLSIWFNCCATYSRIYRNRQGTRYEGRCPRCGAEVCARIGPGGTTRRLFETI